MQTIINVLRQIDENPVRTPGQAAIFDIDDTVLYFNNNTQKWARTKEGFYLFKELQSREFQIFFITARPHSEKNLQWTRLQLKKFGFTDYAGLFLMPKHRHPTSIDISIFKSTLREFVRQTYNAVLDLNIGNAWHDVVLPRYIPSVLNIIHKDPVVFMGFGENIQFCIKLPKKYETSKLNI
jgi:hypothetical protein